MSKDLVALSIGVGLLWIILTLVKYDDNFYRGTKQQKVIKFFVLMPGSLVFWAFFLLRLQVEYTYNQFGGPEDKFFYKQSQKLRDQIADQRREIERKNNPIIHFPISGYIGGTGNSPFQSPYITGQGPILSSGSFTLPPATPKKKV